jgi:hypothetical protein
MKVQTVVDVVPIFVALVPSLLHQNNIGVTYAGTSNFRMEAIRFVPLYFVAMLKSMIIVIEAPFVSVLVHTVVGIKSNLQTPTGTEFVNLHEGMSKEVNKMFVS